MLFILLNVNIKEKEVLWQIQTTQANSVIETTPSSRHKRAVKIVAANLVQRMGRIQKKLAERVQLSSLAKRR
jgi:hypothetical protein